MQNTEATIQPMFLRRKEAAEYLGLSKSHLDRLALEGGGPVFSKPSQKLVLYRVDDLNEWIDSFRVENTSQKLPH
jgi:predicted DNA-binding transcriptional regulator AlpA